MGRAFPIDEVLARVAAAVAPYPPAAMFALADEGHRGVFAQTVACLISVRTRDETTVPAARALFALARTPAAMRALTPAQVADAIAAASFPMAKARQILAIAARADDEFGGELPCDENVLLSLHGVGPKCAHLVLGVACGIPAIAVDVHVHRVTNRWGYVAETTPEKTMAALARILPRRHWVDVNRWLVPFGKHVCTGRLPRCDACPVREWCARVGVGRHR